MTTALNRPTHDTASGRQPLGYRARETILAAVALLMVVGFLLVDGRPRVTFGFFALLSLALIVNLERQRRRAARSKHRIDNRT